MAAKRAKQAGRRGGRPHELRFTDRKAAVAATREALAAWFRGRYGKAWPEISKASWGPKAEHNLRMQRGAAEDEEARALFAELAPLLARVHAWRRRIEGVLATEAAARDVARERLGAMPYSEKLAEYESGRASSEERKALVRGPTLDVLLERLPSARDLGWWSHFAGTTRPTVAPPILHGLERFVYSFDRMNMLSLPPHPNTSPHEGASQFHGTVEIAKMSILCGYFPPAWSGKTVGQIVDEQRDIVSKIRARVGQLRTREDQERMGVAGRRVPKKQTSPTRGKQRRT